jgi:hypothetical protein
MGCSGINRDNRDRDFVRKRKSFPVSNTQIDSPASEGWNLRLRWSGLGLVFLLCGCVSAHQIQKTRGDAVIYGEQQRAREIRERCIDRGAMPGTTAYLECRLKSAK